MSIISQNTKNLINKYINQLIEESSPDMPIWNIEKIKDGKKPSWNYIDGCMMTSLLNLYKITKEKKYFDFVESYIDYYILDNGSIKGYRKETFNEFLLYGRF